MESAVLAQRIRDWHGRAPASIETNIMQQLTHWMWWRKRRLEQQTATQRALEAVFWQGVKAARTEDIMAVEAVMVSLPEYARNSLKHLATVVQVLRKLESRDEQRGKTIPESATRE